MVGVEPSEALRYAPCENIHELGSMYRTAGQEGSRAGGDDPFGCGTVPASPRSGGPLGHALLRWRADNDNDVATAADVDRRSYLCLIPVRGHRWPGSGVGRTAWLDRLPACPPSSVSVE